MKFLAPLFFWSFLSLIPLMAVYFLKVRPRRKLTTAYFLWGKVFTEKKATSLFQRLRDAISLLLMALVFGGVCLALTRPEVSDDERRDLLIMLDTSASMSAGQGSNQRLALAVEAARDLIKGMDAAQRASLATVSQDVQFLSHLTDNPRSLLDALDGLQPSAFPLRREAITSLRAGDSGEWMKNHRLVLITDGCLSGEPMDGVEILKVGEPLENAGIVSADAQFLPGPDSQLGVYLQFASSFKSPVAAELTLRQPDNGPLGKVVNVTIAPGINPGAVYTVSNAAPGKWQAILKLEDGWAGDNEASLAAQQPRPVRVAVTGEDQYFFQMAVESFNTGSALLTLSPQNPQIVLARKSPPAPAADGRAPLSMVFQPEGSSPAWQQTGEVLESPIARVRVPDHPVLRHIDAAGINFAGARKIIPPEGALVLVESDQAVPLIYIATAGGSSTVVVNMDPVESEFYYSAWFPLLVHGAATHLAGREEPLASTYLPGSTLPVPGVSDTGITSIVNPDGSLSSAKGRKFGPVENPGFYTLRNDGGEWLAAVNALSPPESLLDNSSSRTTLGPISKGLPPYLLLTLLALFVLVVESLLYHRRKVG